MQGWLEIVAVIFVYACGGAMTGSYVYHRWYSHHPDFMEYPAPFFSTCFWPVAILSIVVTGRRNAIRTYIKSKPKSHRFKKFAKIAGVIPISCYWAGAKLAGYKKPVDKNIEIIVED